MIARARAGLSTRLYAVTVAAFVLIAVLLSSSIRAQGRGASANVPDGTPVPRTGDGRADLSGVYLIITEVLIGDRAVLISDQAIANDSILRELDLNLHILSDDLQGRAQLLHEEPLCGGGSV